MEDIEVTIYLEDRCMKADIPVNGTLRELKYEFNEICKEDDALAKRRSKFSPTFSILSGTEKSEVKRKYIFKGGEKIHIGWSALELEDTTNSSMSPAETEVFLEESLRSHSSNQEPSVEGPKEHSETGENELDLFEDSDLSHLGASCSRTSSMNNRRVLASVQNLYENTASGSRTTRQSLIVNSDDELSNSNDQPSSQVSDVSDADNGAFSPKQTKRRKERSEYRKPEKKLRTFGTTINPMKSLRKFSVMLQRELKDNKVNMHHVLEEIRMHILQVTGDTYLKKKEMDMLCSSIVKEYPVLADPDSNSKGSSCLRRSIQKSMSSNRYYQKNKENNARPTETQQSRQKPSTSTIPQSENSVEDLTTELQTGAFEPRRIMWLIQKTYKSRNNQFQMAEVKLDLIKQYPHLKLGRLLIYEYQLLIQKSDAALENNAKNLLRLLSKYLTLPQHSVDSSVEILSSIQEQLIPKQLQKQNLRRAITFKDATLVDRNTLAQLNTEQAPCIVCTVTTSKEGKRVLSVSVLLMYDEVISTLKEPNIYQVMQQILAPYWVFDIQYPRAYASLLRLFEKYIHGELSTNTKNNRPLQEYTSLTRDLDNL